MRIEFSRSKRIISAFQTGAYKMKKVLAIILLSLSQSGCLLAAAVDGVTDVAIAVVKVPVKVGAAVVDVATGDEEEKESD